MNIRYNNLYSVARIQFLCVLLSVATIGCQNRQENQASSSRPNFIVIYTDDQRYDALGALGNEAILTPNLDQLANQGMRFSNAFVTLSICSPSRAAMLTGRYGSANGVVTYGDVHLNQDEKTVASILKRGGYFTGVMGKWHLADSPESLGFDEADYFISNGAYYNRKAFQDGKEIIIDGFIEDWNADRALEFLDSARNKAQPFFLYLCTQLPHLDHHHEWDVQENTLAQYRQFAIEPPANWRDDLEGKPPYLKEGRHRQLALDYGYGDRDSLIQFIKRYRAAITETDQALQKVFDYLRQHQLHENTYIFFMGDNGWFIGDHTFTSKVLAYEESMRVPFFVTGPGIQSDEQSEMVLNIDIAPTMLEMAGISVPDNMHGESLLPLLKESKAENWREGIYYEAPEPQLGSYPLFAYRDHRYKYIRTYDIDNRDSLYFEELYNLVVDPDEMVNLALDDEEESLLNEYRIKFEQAGANY